MKIKVYVGDNIKIHHIAGTEKNGITFSGILYDTYSEEQSEKIAKALRNIFTIDLEIVEEQIDDEEIEVNEKEKTADEIIN